MSFLKKNAFLGAPSDSRLFQNFQVVVFFGGVCKITSGALRGTRKRGQTSTPLFDPKRAAVPTLLCLIRNNLYLSPGF